jgi:hypothetical protein
MRSLDFIFETNIIGAEFSDEMKTKFQETLTCVSSVLNQNILVCDVYMEVNDITSNSTVFVKYHITISITESNRLARIRYLHPFLISERLSLFLH